jgi:hypothetical protein
MRNGIGLITLTIATLTALPASARSGEQYRHVPTHAFQVRLGYFAPQGGGDLWEGLDQRFDLNASDFNGGLWGLSFVGGISQQFELGVHVDWYRHTVTSADPLFVDTDGFGIVHDTTFRQLPLGVDLRLLPTGRRPGKPVFYLGLGLGVNIWQYEEVGDFVDEADPLLPVYFGTFRDNGQSLEGRVLAGVEFPISPAFNMTFEGRYTFGETELKGDLAGLGTIDRGGLWVFAGASFRF